MLLNIIDFGTGIQEAIEAPRFSSSHMFSSFSSHKFKPGEMEVEIRVASGVIDALKAKGHVVTVRPPYGMNTGIVAVGYILSSARCAAAPMCVASVTSPGGGEQKRNDASCNLFIC